MFDCGIVLLNREENERRVDMSVKRLEQKKAEMQSNIQHLVNEYKRLADDMGMVAESMQKALDEEMIPGPAYEITKSLESAWRKSKMLEIEYVTLVPFFRGMELDELMDELG